MVSAERLFLRWIERAKKDGLDSLATLPSPGRTRTLTEEEEQAVKSWIVGKDPPQHGFDFGLWTRKIIADLIEHRFGVMLSLNSVWRCYTAKATAESLRTR